MRTFANVVYVVTAVVCAAAIAWSVWVIYQTSESRRRDR